MSWAGVDSLRMQCATSAEIAPGGNYRTMTSPPKIVGDSPLFCLERCDAPAA